MNDDILIGLGEVSTDTMGCPGEIQENFVDDQQPKVGDPPTCP